MASAVLVFAFLCWSSAALAIKDGGTHHAFVLTWPASYCYQSSEGCCLPSAGKPKLDFFVDGLLTFNSTTGGVVTQCNASPFNGKELSGLKDDLLGYWTDVRCPSRDPTESWEKAWNRNGVCSGFSQYKYFEKALALRQKINMLSIFDENGIVPSGENLYNVHRVKRTIEKSLGARVVIECSKNMWEESQLFKIYICLDQNASTIISCPVKSPFKCGEEITFGLFTYEMIHPVTKVIKMYSV